MTAGELEACLRHKLSAREAPGGRHRKYRVFDGDGLFVGWTELSHSWRASTQVSANMEGRIARQLGLARSSELRNLVSCTLSRDEYLTIARSP